MSRIEFKAVAIVLVMTLGLFILISVYTRLKPIHHGNTPVDTSPALQVEDSDVAETQRLVSNYAKVCFEDRTSDGKIRTPDKSLSPIDMWGEKVIVTLDTVGDEQILAVVSKGPDKQEATSDDIVAVQTLEKEINNE